jgi:single stranded DNA-binding protein
MTAQIAVYGRLGADPVQRQSQSGKDWATASLAVGLAKDEDGPPTWFGIVAFGKTAEILCRHAKGDLVSVSGRVQLNRYRDRDGNAREQLQAIADGVISAKSVRPGGGRRREQGGRP